MSRTIRRLGWTMLGLVVLAPTVTVAQSNAVQAIDEEYTRLILEHTQDDRILTELVDHLPASETVPPPLDFHGRIVGTPDELTYAGDIHRYLRAIASASPRATVWSIGQTEEGREMILMAIANEETIANLDQYKGYLQELTDPRATSEERAQQLIKEIAKPIYWLTSGMHSTENGGPEMLQELAYRLVVEDTEFIQEIRDNIVTFITPVIEVDGREKQVDTYYFNKDRPDGAARLPLMYWGKYVAHDNNRDGMLLGLELSRKLMRMYLEWKPQVMHDLHESASHLYASTGTGPYNAGVDPILIDEWHVLAYQEVSELTKRGVPGVWTHSFYDGWGANYAMTAANSHNSIGRFYETQGAGDGNTRRITSRSTRTWYRPNPPLPSTMWSIRNNVNMQQSGILIAMNV